jgi:glycosyltransferase involved in cell wall biosynthesis
MRVCLVLPCYNEASRLEPAVIGAALAARPWLALLFVDDGSRDGTAAVLAALAAEWPRQVTVLALAANGGKARAVFAGMQQALAATDTELLGYWDSDLATPLAEVDRFRAELLARPELALVMGARLRRLGAGVERSLRRHYAGRLFATVASCVLRLPAYDTQCGAKLLRRELAAELFATPFRAGWLFDVELLARLIGSRGRAATMACVYELPLMTWRDPGGSKVRLRHFVAAPLELAGLAWHYRHALARP